MMQDQASSPDQAGQMRTPLPHTNEVHPESPVEYSPQSAHRYEVDSFADIERA